MKKIKFMGVIMAIVVCFTAMFAGCKEYNYYEVPTKTYAKGEEFLQGWSNYNNGYDKDGEEVEKLISVLPSEQQLNYLEMEYYSFIHFGMNTFTGKEWGKGNESPKKFNPKNLSTDQWCEVLKASGSKGIIITAKHHDGFCLWQTETTEHSIKNSPYKNGEGDILAELSESCQKYGLKMGVYLSPWDMNAESYGTDAYHDFYKAQLTELLDGRYGVDTNGDGVREIFCVWMDGALGEEENLDNSYYKMDEYEALIKQLQPDCVTAIQGSDVRWVGNEAGISRPSEWSVISKNLGDENYQTSVGGADDLQVVNEESIDIGSREVLKGQEDLIFKPAEVDVSIRKGWFYHWYQGPKDLDHLLQIYYTSVGGNSSLLLNIPPNKDGLIADKDVEVLKAFGEAIAQSKSKPLSVERVEVGNNDTMRQNELTKNMLDKDGDVDGDGVLNIETDYTSYKLGDDEYIIDFYLSESSQLGRIDLREDLRYSQRVEEFEVWVKADDSWQIIGDSTIIGNRRTLVFENAPMTSQVRIVIKQSRSNPVLRSVELYAK